MGRISISHWRPSVTAMRFVFPSAVILSNP